MSPASFNETATSNVLTSAHIWKPNIKMTYHLCPVSSRWKVEAHHHDPKTNQKSAALRTSKSLPQKKICQAKSIDKMMLIFFFYEYGIIY